MIRYLLVGLIIFLAIAIYAAPAGLVSRALQHLPAGSSVELREARGRVWQGQGTLVIDRQVLGTLQWDVKPASLLLSMLRPSSSVDWDLKQARANLSGEVATGLKALTLVSRGTLDGSALDPWLRVYDLRIGGTFDFRQTDMNLDTETGWLNSIEGAIHWSGGPARFAMGGLLKEVTLPPLIANLSTVNELPQAVVVEHDDATPLLIVTLARDGVVKFALTKKFTRLLSQTWPGSDPDHTVVLSVEEKIF